VANERFETKFFVETCLVQRQSFKETGGGIRIFAVGQTQSLKGSIPTATSTAHHCRTNIAAKPCRIPGRDLLHVLLARVIVQNIPTGSNKVTDASKALARVKSPSAMNDWVMKKGIGTTSSDMAIKAGTAGC